MSAIEKYRMALANLSRFAPSDVDDMFGGDTGPLPAPVSRHVPSTPPASVLWTQDMDTDVSHIGIRVSAPIENPERLVGKMAALAVEKRIVPIFISWIGNCGLQHHGMHVEQIAGATEAERADYEAQLMRMWNLAIIIEADEIATTLG